MLERPLFALLLVTVCAGAHAQAVKLSPSARAPMTRDELRRCLDEEASLLQRRQAQDSERHAIERENSALAQQAAQLADDLKRTDTHDFSKVDDYNARATAHEQRAAALIQRVDAFNADVTALNVEGNRHLAQCAARPYAEEDRAAVLNERKQLSPRVRGSAQ